MFPKEATPKQTHISRIENTGNSTQGYQVRFRRRGRHHSKFFSDGKYGDDQQKAFAAAIQWRDHELLEQPEPILPYEASAEARKTISRGISVIQRDGPTGPYPILQVSWKDPVTKKRKGRSITVRDVSGKPLENILSRIIRQRGEQLGMTQKEMVVTYTKAITNLRKIMAE